MIKNTLLNNINLINENHLFDSCQCKHNNFCTLLIMENSVELKCKCDCAPCKADMCYRCTCKPCDCENCDCD